MAKAINFRARGFSDAQEGKTINAFYEISGYRHTESLRAEYEIGWRAFQEEARAVRAVPMTVFEACGVFFAFMEATPCWQRGEE